LFKNARVVYNRTQFIEVTETGVSMLNDSTNTDDLNKTRTTESSMNNSFESRHTANGDGEDEPANDNDSNG
jgi:hypothetical protein